MDEYQVRTIVREEILKLMLGLRGVADESASEVLEDDSLHRRFNNWQGTKSLAYEAISTISDIIADKINHGEEI